MRLAALAVACSVCFAGFVVGGCSSSEPLDAAQNVDLAQLQGKWFEISKLPRATQADCTGTTATYTFREGGLDIVNECHRTALTGELKTSTMRATLGGEGSGKMSLDVGGWSGDYWILEVGTSYEYAVIGVPSRDYLWILSRTPTMDPTVRAGIVQRAQANKFDVTRLQDTVQTATAAAPPNASLQYGCALSPSASAASGSSDRLPVWAGFLGLLGAVALRRRRA
jgi:apolipoprotein D and lipocalin family protein